jgi:hypothetical protein
MTDIYGSITSADIQNWKNQVAYRPIKNKENQMQSETIGALAAALSKAQADITGALKDSSNPFFKSKYADLASCWDACRKQLAANGLSVIQTTQMTEQGLMLVTTLAHASGEWIAGQMPVLTKDASPQGQGSGITYARRYALAAIVGLAQVDDDAEAAQGRKTEPAKIDNNLLGLIATVQTAADLNALYKRLNTEQRMTHIDAFTARKKELTGPEAA